MSYKAVVSFSNDYRVPEAYKCVILCELDYMIRLNENLVNFFCRASTTMSAYPLQEIPMRSQHKILFIYISKNISQSFTKAFV